MKLIPILLVLSSCAFGADNASKIPEISSIQSEYEYNLKSSYSTYITEVKKLESKVIKKMEEKLKLITVTGDLDKAILIKAEIEKIKNGSMRQDIILAVENQKGTDLLGNDVEKKPEGANSQVLSVVCGKWKATNGSLTMINNDGSLVSAKGDKGKWKFENNKAILTWTNGVIQTWVFINNDSASITTNKGESATLTRVIESR